jgi:N-acyl-D-amino-acid deacylase
VFELDRITWPDDYLVNDTPGGAPRLRRPWGGYRATIVNGAPTQIDGAPQPTMTGRMLDAAARRRAF